MTKTPDLINHPPHYTQHPSGVEVIEIARALPFALGSAVKYVMRRNLKGDPTENLAKAKWMLNDYAANPVEGWVPTVETVELARVVLDAEPNLAVAEFLRWVIYGRTDVTLPLLDSIGFYDAELGVVS